MTKIDVVLSMARSMRTLLQVGAGRRDGKAGGAKPGGFTL
jgi:hypothetical protein